MKYSLFAALSLVSLFASANDNVSGATATAVQESVYDYAQDLDIAKVIRITSADSAASECGPVTAQMEYVDSKGITHRLQYMKLGQGCDKG